jgi:ferric-dicitrate binding protein FerR (iron transport regulator)
MNPQDDHLESLLDAYFEGKLDAAAQEDLNRIITSSSQAREQFWERAGIEGSLESWAARTRGESMAVPATATLPPATWRRHLPAISGWAVAAALALAWLLQSGPRPESPPANAGPAQASRPIAREAADDMPVAYLSRVSGLGGDSVLLQGYSLAAGREVAIGEGLLELDFFSGARVSIKGPARILPESDMRLVVREGLVQVDVPDSAKGFVLTLPDGTVTDFGTSFEVEVRNGKTSRLQVSRGEVELAGTKDNSAAKRIFRGEALTLTDSGGSRPISFSPLALKNSIAESIAKDDALRAEKWEKICGELAVDPSVLVHFRFLPDEEGSREILNRATGPNVPRTGTVIAAEWSRGRWEGKAALSFHGLADRVRVDIPGEYPQATFFAWVKVNDLPRRYNGLFLSESGIPGEVHWQFSEDGRFKFGVRPKEFRPDWSFHRAFSEPVLNPSGFGTWRLLATTYDANLREVIHFVDGQEVARASIEDTVPLRFGRATLGNFFDPAPAEHANSPGLGENWSFRNWSGAIDEFLLFSRVLDAKEIGRLHEAGRPD